MTLEQQLSALGLANRVRRQNGVLLGEVRALPRREGLARAATMLEACEPGSLTVERVLGSPRSVGPLKVASLLRQAGISLGSRKVRDVSLRQRQVLAGELRKMAG